MLDAGSDLFVPRTTDYGPRTIMLKCIKCQRANPPDATYCHFDGALLAQGRVNGGPVRAAMLQFPREFVFPSGRRCRNFDEFCLACIQERPAAIDLLKGGYLESFLGGIGRGDLAAVARQAGQFPDRQRGLDMLIERLPSQVVEPPRLQVEPLNVNVGQLWPGQDHRLNLHITNQGMRLLYGTLTVEETPWIALGDAPGLPEKSFDCEHELVIPVLILGKKLKAGKNTLQGRIAVDSNGGSAEVVIKVDVPVKPFAQGVLAGALAQRQLAEQAFKEPKEAAPLFESGAVARWYAENGWTYPVQGPTASGIGALQQFLEACGLTQPPKVELETQSLMLYGDQGGRVEGQIRLRAREKRPIFAHAVSDQAWLKTKPAVLSGVNASIPLEVGHIPFSLDGNDLKARVTVVANGRQKFIVPVTLRLGQPPPPRVAAVVPTPRKSAPELVELVDDDKCTTSRRREGAPAWVHLLPAALLAMALLLLVGMDALRPRIEKPAETVTLPPLGPAENDETLYLVLGTRETYDHRFGLSVAGVRKDQPKQLTFDPEGKTNNTVVRIDGQDLIFGVNGDPGPGQRNRRRPDEIEPGKSWRTVWQFPDTKIIATQEISIRRSDQTGKLETCLVKYTLRNAGTVGRKVGLRFMLDTYIGENDGVPFTIPGHAGLCDTQQLFNNPTEIPDFIQALEHADLKNPGTVAHLTLKVLDSAGKIEPPTRVQLGAWPNQSLQAFGYPTALGSMTRWEVPLAPIRALPQQPDSAVTLYWDEKYLEPGQSREMAFAYGLGKVSSTGRGAGKLAVTVSGTFRPGGEFTVTAYVANPESNQKATLVLPSGLRLADGGSADRPVQRSPVGAFSPVTWKVKADRTGDYDITVQTGGLSQSERVKIRAKSFLD